ncbi:urokinase plasminogen activator surface receptor-like isoform X2 [Scyliorhinus canicula]|uniref:urokinase plasminogen activator surface receptor-like isoform X2 n=1 Tax=Scyliorhinus canicula TaxID=7830 RepID=UPI0018F7CA56|nr:urokinase plasminogen activator surface receptor-like isoform X2 [Scyliorhinus canicula]
MKLLFNIVNICMCFAVVRSLTCLQCSGSSGTCNLNDETCTAGTTSCQTVSSTSIIEGITTRRISQKCSTASNDFSLNSGVVSISQSNSFCESDRCNNQTVSEPANTTVNGLQCFGCYNSSSESCINSLRRVNCVGAENRCFNATGIQEVLVGIGQNLTTRGCVSENICQGISLGAFSIRLSEVTCCEEDLCNGDVSTPTGSSTSAPVAASTLTPVAASTLTPVANSTLTPVANSTLTPVATGTLTPAPINTTAVTTNKTTESQMTNEENPKIKIAVQFLFNETDRKGFHNQIDF